MKSTVSKTCFEEGEVERTETVPKELESISLRKCCAYTYGPNTTNQGCSIISSTHKCAEQAGTG